MGTDLEMAQPAGRFHLGLGGPGPAGTGCPGPPVLYLRRRLWRRYAERQQFLLQRNRQSRPYAAPGLRGSPPCVPGHRHPAHRGFPRPVRRGQPFLFQIIGWISAALVDRGGREEGPGRFPGPDGRTAADAGILRHTAAFPQEQNLLHPFRGRQYGRDAAAGQRHRGCDRSGIPGPGSQEPDLEVQFQRCHR